MHDAASATTAIITAEDGDWMTATCARLARLVKEAMAASGGCVIRLRGLTADERRTPKLSGTSIPDVSNVSPAKRMIMFTSRLQAHSMQGHFPNKAGNLVHAEA